MTSIKARRSFLSYVVYAAFTATLFDRAFFPAADHTYAAVVIWKFILVPLVALLLVRMIFYPNYLVANGETITIHRDHFIDQKIIIENLDKVQLSSTPFKPSYFVLKSHAKIPFSYFDLDSKTSKAFFEKLGKPIKDI